MRRLITLANIDGLEQTYQIAGVGSRAYAYGIDLLVRIGALLIWNQVAINTWNQTVLQAFMEALRDSRVSTTFLGAIIIWFSYHLVFEYLLRGRTIGKQMVGIKIVNIKGRPPSFFSTLFRQVLRVVDFFPGNYGLGMLLMVNTDYQNRLGDVITRTLAVHSVKTDLRYKAQVSEHEITEDQREYVQELLGRWESMKLERRVQLARDFLKSIGKEAPAGIVDETIDSALRSQLKAITKQ